MGIFEKLGREVEKFKQSAVETAEGEASYACVDCGKRLYTQHDGCPECGGAVRRLEVEETRPEDDEPGVDSEEREADVKERGADAEERSPNAEEQS